MLIGRGLESLSPNCLSGQDRSVNISDNDFRSLESISFFPHLEEIIADCNHLTESLQLPKMPFLRTLSLNKNKIGNLEQLLNILVEKTPTLRILSLLGNPVSPDPIYRHLCRLSQIKEAECEEPLDSIPPSDDSGAIDHQDDEDEYQRYRLRILYRLPGLQFLDSTAVSTAERAEAKRRGEFLVVKTVESPSTSPQTGSGTLGSLAPGVSNWLASNLPIISSSNTHTFSPLAVPDKPEIPKVSYGKNQYIYQGKFSEGNRFLKDNDL